MCWTWANIDWDKTLAVLVGIAAMVQAAVAIVMMRGLRHSRDAAKVAAAALELSRNTAVRQLRAYVDAPDVELQMSGEAAAVRVLFENCGQTPAYDVRARTQLLFGPPDTIDQWEFPEAHPFSPRGTVGAGAKASLMQQIEQVIWNANVAALNARTTTIGLAVEVRYRDTFDQQRSFIARRQLRPDLHPSQFASTPRVDVGD